MSDLEKQYQTIPHNTIEGIKQRLVYWRDQDNTLVKCTYEGDGVGWYSNYYYKSFIYFSTVNFLQDQYIEVRQVIPTRRRYTLPEYETAKLIMSFLGGGVAEGISMKNELTAHLYNLCLEYLFKAIWVHSNLGVRFSSLHSTRKTKIQTHNLWQIFQMWDKDLQQEIAKLFDATAENYMADWGLQIQGTLEQTLLKIQNVEIGTNRYNPESTYPVAIRSYFQYLAEFFFFNLLSFKEITGYDNEPLFMDEQ